MPTTSQYQQNLIQGGLSPSQALVYEILLKNGPLPARKIARETPYKRTLVYKTLEELQSLGLVVRHDEPGKISIFEPQHPVKLKEVVEKQEQKAKIAQSALESVLGNLVSDFNLISGQPGIKFYEGLEGAKKVLDDSLTAKEEIYSYVDNESVKKYIPEINEEYKRKRSKLGVRKKMITIDSPYIHKAVSTYDPKVSEVRVVSTQYPFFTVMQIYDNKVSYLTLDEKKMIGIIIEDPHIAAMHKSLFEYTWANAKPLLPLEKPALA